MRAIIHNGEAGMTGLEYTEFQEPNVKKGRVKIKLKAAGLNHRDLFVLQRNEGKESVVLGSDGAGIIEAVGEGVENIQTGDEVVIVPSLHWKEKSAAPPGGFEILGFPNNGTFAEYIVVPADNVVPKPSHFTWEEAGVFPLGSLTAYRALVTRGQIQSGQTVFIPGAGSGVATQIIQMAKAKGARVIVSSRSEKKRNKALELGADLAVADDDDWKDALNGESVDLVIESVGAATWQRSLDLLKAGGTVVVFGASAGDEITLNLRDFFYGQYNLLGSTMGSIEEFREMTGFVSASGIKPVVDSVYELSEMEAAMNKLEDAAQFGKIAFKI